MDRKYFIMCVVFSIWTIIQTGLHLVFVIYGYYLSICEASPTQTSTVFFYLTYLYQKKCKHPVLQQPPTASFSIETYFSTILDTTYSDYNSNGIVDELLNNTEEFPQSANAASRTSNYFLIFIIADGVWIVTAVGLLVGTCFGIKQTPALFFYGPWLLLTTTISILDLTVLIHFSLDIAETTNFNNWLKFVGIENPQVFSDLDSKNPTVFLPLGPTFAMCLFSSRFILLWILNIICLVLTFKATRYTLNDKFTKQQNPTTTIMDDSAARIRSWQLFYGAIESTSSHNSSSSSKGGDVNSNNNNNNKESQPNTATGISLVLNNANFYYRAYSDVADDIDDDGMIVDELRGQVPWSYIAHKDGNGRKTIVEEINKGTEF